MKIAGRWWKLPLVRVTSAAVVLLAVCAALAADPPSNLVDKKDPTPSAKPADKKDTSASTKRIKVFRLKTATTADVQEKLDALLATPAAGETGGEGSGALAPAPGGMIGGLPPGGGGVAGFGGIGGLPAGVGGLNGIGGFGGIGGFCGGLPMPNPRYKIAVDERTNAVVVRGTEGDLQVAAELVALMELPKAKTLPPLKHLKAFRLKHGDAAAMVTLLNELEVDARVVALVEPNLVVVSGPEEVTKDIAEAIKELDREVKEAPAKPAGMQ